MKNIFAFACLLTLSLPALAEAYNSDYQCVSKKASWSFEIVSSFKPSYAFKKQIVKTTEAATGATFSDPLSGSGQYYGSSLYKVFFDGGNTTIQSQFNPGVIAECSRAIDRR